LHFDYIEETHSNPPTVVPYTLQTWKLVLRRYHTYSFTYLSELQLGPNLLEMMGSMMVVRDKMVIDT
jgi:hypothetical protein